MVKLSEKAVALDSSRVQTSSAPWRRDLSLVVGLTVCIQLALYWSSFVGTGVLLPVHILTRPGIYLPQDLRDTPLPNYGRSDLVQVSEPHRWFMASEYRAGRIPLWTPYAFSGTPLARAPIFSPFELLYVLWPSPRVLPWIQLATAIVAATGAWRCANCIFGLGSLAAVMAGATYPLTGFLTLWQGYDLSYPVVFFPWQVLAALALVESITSGRIVVLAITTALTLISGPVDMAAMVLLATGLIWTWHVIVKWWSSESAKSIARLAAATTIGWSLGFLLSAPAWLHTIDYVKSGTRLATRNTGKETRPPIGWKALPLIFFPEAFGTEKDDSIFAHESGVRLESAAGAYGGCIALLFAVPCAWLDRSRRSWVLCLSLIAILGVSWQLKIPGFVGVWRLPGLKMLSANRMVFASAWSILMLAAIGLQQLQLPSSSPRWSMHICVYLSLLCLLFCLAGFFFWPDEIRRLVPRGQPGQSLVELQTAFLSPYWHQLGWLILTLILWAVALFFLRREKRLSGWLPIVAMLLILEPLSHVWNLHPQPDPGLYYPRLPALEFIQRSPPGRVLGMNCLPPKLMESHQLRDIRGYDGVDPLPYIELLSISFDKQRTSAIEYARTMWYFPVLMPPSTPEESFRLHPALNMLGLRYLVFAESVELKNPLFQDEGYSIYENQHAFPRAWIPQHVVTVSSSDLVVKSMFPWNFDPAVQAYVTSSDLDLPEKCSGSASVVQENPQAMSLTASMDTPGLVIIGDRYDSGWEVTVDGQSQRLLCVNHVLRGVVVPQGSHTIELQYRPAAFAFGVKLFAVASIILLTLSCWSISRSYQDVTARQLLLQFLNVSSGDRRQ